MLKVMKLIKATAIGDKTLELVYEDGVKRTFDISPYIKGSWMGSCVARAHFPYGQRIVPLFRGGRGGHCGLPEKRTGRLKPCLPVWASGQGSVFLSLWLPFSKET